MACTPIVDCQSYSPGPGTFFFFATACRPSVPKEKVAQERFVDLENQKTIIPRPYGCDGKGEVDGPKLLAHPRRRVVAVGRWSLGLRRRLITRGAHFTNFFTGRSAHGETRRTRTSGHRLASHTSGLRTKADHAEAKFSRRGGPKSMSSAALPQGMHQDQRSFPWTK